MKLEKEAEVRSNRYIPVKEQNVYARLKRKGYEDGYIAGAEAHSVQWHDLRKDPNDLPKNSDDEKLYLVYWDESDYSVVQFNDGRWWSLSGGWYDAEDVIAWCEVPKFEEE